MPAQVNRCYQKSDGKADASHGKPNALVCYIVIRDIIYALATYGSTHAIKNEEDNNHSCI